MIEESIEALTVIKIPSKARLLAIWKQARDFFKDKPKITDKPNPAGDSYKFKTSPGSNAAAR